MTKEKARRTDWPHLQSDERWAEVPIWDAPTVARIAQRDLAYSAADAKDLLSGGNTFADQGCQLCCLSMILERLDDKKRSSWTPIKVHELAQKYLYVTSAGLSLVPLYADLCVDITAGGVQLCAKENYAPNEGKLPRRRLLDVHLIRAYRGLPRPQRDDFVVMLRIGTHDETVAAHYLLIDPEDTGPADSEDVTVLDPAMPVEMLGAPWSLMDAARNFFESDEEHPASRRRTKELKAANVKPGDIAAVQVFARWRNDTSSLLGVLADALVEQERRP